MKTDAVIGFDTSNYRTSVAVIGLDGRIFVNERKLLEVESGKVGLRQSDAVYMHLKQMKMLFEKISGMTDDVRIVAACASTRPRDRENSYMPVFEVGDTLCRGIGVSLGVPCFFTNHQYGHIRAALYQTTLDPAKPFLAFHLSGGTMDLLSVTDGKIREMGTSLDLYAGQLIDRVGALLGLSFPAGPELERLAEKGSSCGILGCSLEKNDLYCHLSGAETKCRKLLSDEKISPENLAREIYDLIARTAARMIAAASKETGMRDVLLCGGVSSSALFRKLLTERCGKLCNRVKLYFGFPELSGDNAVGVALYGMDEYRRLYGSQNT